MQKQDLHPLFFDPPTTEQSDNGLVIGYTIKPSELTPFGAKAVDFIVLFFSLIFVLWIAVGLIELPHIEARDCLFAIALFFSARILIRKILLVALRVTTVIVMTKGELRIRRRFWWKSYDLNLDHRFELVVHDRAKQEQQDNEFKIRKAGANGKVIRKPVYYGESFIVAMLYEGHRVDLLSVFGLLRAQAVLARLQYCGHRLRKAAKIDGSESNPHVDDEWSDTPGGLDNE